MLPFLKKAKEGALSGPVDTVEREPDDGVSYDMVDAIADDFLAALEKKDKAMLKSALQSLCDYIQDKDIEQDAEMKGQV